MAEKYSIGVFGSSSGREDLVGVAQEIGRGIAKISDKATLVTGGGPGLPYAAASEAAKHGAEVIGFSPTRNVDEHLEYHSGVELKIYSRLKYIDPDFAYADNRRVCIKYRNVLATAYCDTGIFIGGGWGSLNEFTNLIDFQKVIGVLTGTGGVADEIASLHKKIYKEGQGTVIFESDSGMLLRQLLKEIENR